MPRTGRPPSWSPDQLTYLKEQCRTRSTHDVALEMGMNKATARYYLRKWGVPILTCRKKWTSEEDAKLRDLVVDHTTVELAALLECTEVAVRVRAHKLRLSVNQTKRRCWTKFEDIFILGAAERMSLREAGIQLNRSKMSVWARCQRLGIKWTQGRRSAKEVAADLGCHPSYIRRLAKKAGIQLTAIRGGGMMNISDDQYEALLEAWFGPTAVNLAA